MYDVIISSSALILGILIGAVAFRSRPKIKAVYYDSSGVSSNPPNVFEMKALKTFNVAVDDKHVIQIPMISAGDGLLAMSRLSALYGSLCLLIGESEKNGVQADQVSIVKITAAITSCIFVLASPYTKKNVWKFFYARCFKDTAFLFQLSREIIDLWVKKKRQMEHLAAGEPSRKMDGGPVYVVMLRSQVIPSLKMRLYAGYLKLLSKRMKTFKLK